MRKTYSQKVAAVFEIIGYVLLFPASFGVMGGLGSLFVGLLSGSAEVFLYGLLNLIVIGIGVYLLVGYHKHAAGRLSAERVLNLWTATAVFNFVLLLPWLSVAAYSLQSGKHLSEDGQWFNFFGSLLMVAPYVFIIHFALKARSCEKRRKTI